MTLVIIEEPIDVAQVDNGFVKKSFKYCLSTSLHELQQWLGMDICDVIQTKKKVCDQQ